MVNRHLHLPDLGDWPLIDQELLWDDDDLLKTRSFTVEEWETKKRERLNLSRRIEQQHKLHPMRSTDLGVLAYPNTSRKRPTSGSSMNGFEASQTSVVL